MSECFSQVIRVFVVCLCSPASVGVENFLASMKTLRRAMEYFTERCPGTEEMSQAVSFNKLLSSIITDW